MPFFDKYPYTNFHNVNLDWILERVKEWGQMVEDNNTRFENLQEANEAFKEYVTTYLENLDVQTAIDDKLDRMFESGELTEYLQPYISPVVTTWLDQHITEPEGVVIDSSLTVAGAAADAKATGLVAFPIDAKNYLINCLMAMYWNNPRARIYIENLELSLFKFSIYNKYLWKLSTHELVAVHCNGAFSTPENYNGNGILRLSDAGGNANKFRVICASRGLKPLIDESSQLPTIYYPIPVPKEATGITVYANFNSYWLGIEPAVYDTINDIYIHIPSGTGIGTAWTEGIIQKTFNFVPDNTYIIVIIRANRTASIEFDANEPTEVNIEFTRG